MVVEAVPRQLSPDLIREVALGRDTTISRREAVVLLRDADLPDKPQIFRELLSDEREAPSLRYRAVTALYQLKLPETQDILLESSRRIQDPRVLEGVVKGLGRIGDEEALDAVKEIKERSEGRVAKQAEFAAQLIAHRLGLRGFALPFPSDDALLELEESRSHVFEFGPASGREARVCLESLASEPFGIDHAEERAYQIDCLDIRQMLLTNMALARDEAVGRLAERNAILAIVASYFETNDRYSTAFLVFTEPRREAGSVRLLAHRPNGEQLFAGTGRIEDGQLNFAMKAVSRPGGFPITAKGVFQAGRFEMSMALSGSYVRDRREPSKG